MGTELTAIELAKKFHEAYERLSPSFGYTTREETREFDPDSANGRLMIAVCKELSQQPPVYAMSRDLSVVAVHLRPVLDSVRHNIRVYEDMPEERITDESRDKTLSDLREDESKLVEAIARLAPSPQAVTVEGMSPVWSPAQDEFDTPCWVTGCKCAIGPICKPDLYCARCGTPIDHSRVDVDRAPASTNT